MATKWATQQFAAVFAGGLGFLPSSDVAGAALAPRAPQVRAAPQLSWLERLDRWFWRLEQERIDGYLAQATDIADLEERMRALERRRVVL